MQGETAGRVIGAHHYNGKIDRPCVAGRALGREQVRAMLQRPVPVDLLPAVVAAWDFSRAIPTARIEDVSANRLGGELVNLPTRGDGRLQLDR